MTNGENLVLEYCFNEKPGDQIINDTGPEGLNTKLEDDPDNAPELYYRPIRAAGYVGGGLRFDGTALLNVGHHSVLNMSSITLMAWVRYSWDGYPNASEVRQEVMEKVGSYWLNIRKDGRKLRAGFRTCDGNRRRLDSITEIPEDTWAHVATTFQDQAMAIYINGKKDVEEIFDGYPCDSQHPLTIGARYSRDYVGPDAFFYGTIDAVRVYSRALNADEIKRMMDMGDVLLPQAPSGLRST